MKSQLEYKLEKTATPNIKTLGKGLSGLGVLGLAAALGYKLRNKNPLRKQLFGAEQQEKEQKTRW